MISCIKKIFTINFLIACLCNNFIVVAQSSFNPADISGLKLWLRSDTGLVLTNNIVDQWNDISGNNNNAFQTISSIKPTWHAADTLLNNYPVIKFDGVDSRLETMYVQPDAYSVFIVYSHRNGTNGSFYSTNQSGYPLQRNTTIWPNSNLAPYALNLGNSLNTNNLYVDVHDFMNDNYSTYLNGIQYGNSNAPLPKSGGFFNIGSGGSEPLNGNIAEFLIYDSAIADSLRIKVETYLMNKYAPAVNLGVDKTVCTFPITLNAKKDYFLNYLWQNMSTADSLVVNGPGTYYLTTTDIFNKVTSDTIVISLSPPTYTATLGNDTTICSGQQLVLNAGPDNLNYAWSTSSTSHSISINTGGTYSVSVIDCSGNITTDIINVIVQAPPAFNFGSNDTIICSNSAFVLDPGFGTSSPFTFHWQDNTNTSSYSVSANGQYYLDVTDNIGCKSSDTINIQIDNSLNLLSLGPDKQLCSGNLITLTQGVNPSLTYIWSTGSNNDSLLIINAGQYSVIVTNTNNCIAKDTIDIIIQGFAPIANFSSNIGCVNQIVSFTDLSIPPSGNSISNYAWSFGDTASPTNTSTASNPIHTYTNTGTYTVNLTVTTNLNCEQSITKVINVYPVPTATFAIGTSCQNDNTAFLNQSTSPSSYSITSSYWNFGDSSPTSTTSITSPNHIFSNSTVFTVKLLVTNTAGCKDSIYKTVNVQDEVKADFTNGPACLNSPTNFLSTSIIPTSGTPTYDWNFVNSTANTPAPIKTYTNAGVYYVTLTVDGNNGCTSTITKLVNVYLPPIASFSIPSFCAKDTINVINLSNPQSGIISSYNWRLNNITFSTVQSPTLSLANPGNNSIRLTTINSFGCKDSTTNSLTIFPLPLVDFSTTPTAFYYENEPINFMPSITNASSYLWNMNGTSTYSIQSPTETFNTEGSYNVVLNLIDQNGCKGSKTKTITVSKRQLDLAILNVSTTKDNDGFMTVIADIANYGSVPINSFKMGYQISDGGNIKETWNGTLNPNSFYTFTFNALSASMQNSTNNVTCVEIEKVNTGIDDNTTNNFLCNSLNTDDIYVANPLPNPTNGDIILPITLNRGFDYTVAIYNSVGQIQYEETTKKGIEGLNFVTLNTSSYARGAYIIKIMIDEKIFIKKFIKISYE